MTTLIKETVLGDDWNESGYQMWDALAKVASFGLKTNIILYFYVHVDANDTERMGMYLDQAALGYYRGGLINGFNDTYVQYYYKAMVDSAILMGADKARAHKEMEQALRFEIKLANILDPFKERRDASKLYNKKTVRDLEGQPGYPPSIINHINKIFAYAGVPEVKVYENDTVILRSPTYFEKLSEVLRDTSKRDIANYIAWSSVFLFFSKSEQCSKKYPRRVL